MVQWVMQSINLTLSVAEIKALLQIGQNQLFRMKFLDPKMPGYKAHPGELEAAESAIRVLEADLKEDKLRDPTSWETPTRHSPVQQRGK